MGGDARTRHTDPVFDTLDGTASIKPIVLFRARAMVHGPFIQLYPIGSNQGSDPLGHGARTRHTDPASSRPLPQRHRPSLGATIGPPLRAGEQPSDRNRDPNLGGNQACNMHTGNGQLHGCRVSKHMPKESFCTVALSRGKYCPLTMFF